MIGGKQTDLIQLICLFLRQAASDEAEEMFLL